MSTKTLAIMFTDIKGFTERVSRQSRDETNFLLSQHERLLVPVFNHFKGTVAKTIGDAFMVHFESPTDSVLCGLAIQEVLRQYNETVSEAERIDVRVAINIGEVTVKGVDVFGEAVNIASRLEGITEAGEVYFTEAVYLSMQRREVPTTEVGERTFKGIPYPIRVYRVLRDPGSERVKALVKSVQMTNKGPVVSLQRPASTRATRRRLKIAAALLVSLAVAGAAAYRLFGPAGKERIQLALLLDTSTGTEGLISQAQDGFWRVVNGLSEMGPLGRDATVEVALYELGNNGLDPASDFVRRLNDFTTELDFVAANLATLRASEVRGSDENFGAAIQRAVSDLAWKPGKSAYRAIVVAGNESFKQGPVRVADALSAARAKGVTVHTIFYGSRARGAEYGWEDGADLGGGKYRAIAQNQPVVAPSAPEDDQIVRLGGEINKTFIPVGDHGRLAARLQLQMDAYAQTERESRASVERAVFKGSSQYGTATWDLIAAARSGSFDFDALKRELPGDVQADDVSALRAFAERLANERRTIQAEIRRLADSRLRHIRGERGKSVRTSQDTIDHAILSAIRRHTAARAGDAP